MLGTWFYHKRVRMAVSVFGSMFNNIYVLRQNSSGETISQIKVPLSYAPKRSFLERLEEMKNGEEQERRVAMKLPRMSFEITSMTYDAIRQLPKTNTFSTAISGDVSKRNQFYASVPYDIGFDVSIYAKSQDDALQIVEQILPYFNPQYTITVKPFYDDHPDIKEDVPIILQGVTFSDDFEGSIGDRRTIVYTLSFVMKVNFYGPNDTANVIREVHQNLYTLVGDSDTEIFQYRHKTVPTPTGVDADSDYGFNFSHLDSAI
jgi:hypothetical protein